MLGKSKGNMYGWVTHTYNPIKGKCSHDCVYCYMKMFPQKPIRLDETELKQNLGEKNTIFVGSSTDMFAENVPAEWIKTVLKKCRDFDRNTYLFQTKNPTRFEKFKEEYPTNTIFGITLETNREDNLHKAISRQARVSWMTATWMKKKMITIEPILDFDLVPLVEMVRQVNPNWVNIGADSKNHHLPEPKMEKVWALITELSKFTEVKQKHNLRRLLTTI